MSEFPPDVLDALRSLRTVAIETARAPGTAPRETTIWIVVDEKDRVLVRSVRGPRGRWYRDLLANPRGALLLSREPLGVRAEPAPDAERVEACSRALRAKYANARGSLASMLQPEILDATLELHPA